MIKSKCDVEVPHSQRLAEHAPPISQKTGKPTFTLVAVSIPAKDLPSNTRRKVKQG